MLDQDQGDRYAGEVGRASWDVATTDPDSGITGRALATVTPAAADHFQIDAPATVEPFAVVRPHHAPLSLVETLDQLFMEEGLLG